MNKTEALEYIRESMVIRPRIDLIKAGVDRQKLFNAGLMLGVIIRI